MATARALNQIRFSRSGAKQTAFNRSLRGAGVNEHLGTGRMQTISPPP